MEYESAPKNSSANESGPTVEIRIPAEFATTANRQVTIYYYVFKIL